MKCVNPSTISARAMDFDQEDDAEDIGGIEQDTEGNSYVDGMNNNYYQSTITKFVLDLFDADDHFDYISAAILVMVLVQ